MQFVNQEYGNKLRLRVTGILVENEKVLLIKHRGIGTSGYLWSPPGGGMEYNFSIQDNLKREYLEETGLDIEVVRFMFVNEVILKPLHAVELFFLVKKAGGNLKLGHDPESGMENQIIESINFFSFAAINKMKDDTLHNLFKHCRSISELLNMNGYFNY